MPHFRYARPGMELAKTGTFVLPEGLAAVTSASRMLPPAVLHY